MWPAGKVSLLPFFYFKSAPLPLPLLLPFPSFLCHYRILQRLMICECADNHMINGTKLLNVAGMTRGRRDGILKSEKVRHVVKIGPMHLKGVW